MSTETTGTGKPEAAAEVEPPAVTDAAEPAATAVARPPAAAMPIDAEAPAETAQADETSATAGGRGETAKAGHDPEAAQVSASCQDAEAAADESAERDGSAGAVELGSDEPSDPIDPEPVEQAEPAEEFTPARRWPRVLLAAGFVVLGLAIIGAAVIIVGSLTHGFKKPVQVTYKKSALFSLQTGDCLDPRGQSYSLIACSSPHQAEVYATFALTGTKWPGNAAIAADASGGCASRLSGYLNPQLAVSLSSTYVYPDATAWQAGTRTVICEVRAASGLLTGSVRGASATAG